MTASSASNTARHTLLVLFSGVFMAALDVAIVAPALPLLRSAFGVDNSAASLLVVVYSLFSLAGAQPLAALSDRYGTRRVFLGAVAAFAGGSLLVALAPSLAVALLGRAIQGVSAGGITPAASAVVGENFPVEQRGKALGLIGATFGMAFLIGPLLASLVLLVLPWQSLFLINLPLASMIVLAGMRWLPRTPPPGAVSRFDVAGTLLVFVLLASLTLAVNGIVDRWLGIVAWPWLLALGALSLGLLVLVERRAARPIVPLTVFRSLQLKLAYLLTVGAGFGMGSVVYVSSLGVAAFEVPEQQAGLLLVAVVLSSAAGSVLFGRLLFTLGSRTVLLIGFGCVAVGSLLLALFSYTLVGFVLATSVLGAGVGNVVGGVLRYIVLNEAASRERTAAQGLVNIGTNVGNMLVVVVLGAVADSRGGLDGYRTAYLLAAAVAALLLLPALGLRGRTAERSLIASRNAPHVPGSPSQAART